MLFPAELAKVNWHPLRVLGRTDNYALGHLGVVKGVERVRRGSMTGSFGGPVIYQMACGHSSLPGHAVCERGCLKAPAYPVGGT